MCYIPRRNFLGLLAFMTASYVSVGIGHRAAKAQADNCVQGYGYLEAYTSSTSVFPGESLSIHVRAAKAYNSFYIDIYRMGKDEVYIPLTQDGQREQAQQMTIPRQKTPTKLDVIGHLLLNLRFPKIGQAAPILRALPV